MTSSPVAMTQEERQLIWESSEFYITENFEAAYQKHKAALIHLSGIAEYYIAKNWKSVKNWSDLSVTCKNGHKRVINTGEEIKNVDVDFFKYIEPKKKSSIKSTIAGRLFKKFEEEKQACANQVIQIDFLFDFHHNDLSAHIIGEQFIWSGFITGDTSIIIADYIEQQLKNE